MYMRKKLDEMTVVCESFLEHLRVQSQVLVGALELTWPPAGWALCRPSRPPPHNLHFLTSPLDGELNRACGRDSKEISFLPETRHSSPPSHPLVSVLYDLPLAVSAGQVSCQLQMSVQCPPPPPLLAK